MGAGNTKNRRGAGCRGGRGKAGTNKHKFHTYGIIKPRKYRQKIIAAKGKAIKLCDLDSRLDEMVKQGKATKDRKSVV